MVGDWDTEAKKLYILRICGRRDCLVSLMISQFASWLYERSPAMKARIKPRKNCKRRRKSVLRLPDLEHAKSAVLSSLTNVDAQRGYSHAINEFVDWYCSEPRLAFNRVVVLRYRVIWSQDVWRQERSTCGSALCGVGL
jgi:hypothetical protein